MIEWPKECVFCQIVHFVPGSTPCMGTDFWDVLAFEPLNPRVPGHMLFVPVEHVHAARAVPMVTGRVMEAAARHGSQSDEDFNLITSDGSSATQTVFHLHVHYLPRAEGDGLLLPWSDQT